MISNKLTISLKLLIVLLVSIFSIFLYNNVIQTDSSFITLFEQYFPDNMFDLYLIINRETILFALPLSLFILSKNKLSTWLLFLPLSMLLIVTGAINYILIFSYLILLMMNDQIGKKNYFYSVFIISIILFLNILLKLDLGYYLPIALVFTRTLISRKSPLFDVILAFVLVSYFNVSIYSNINVTIAFVGLYLSSYIKNRSIDPLSLLAFWSIFIGASPLVYIGIFCVYLLSKFSSSIFDNVIDHQVMAFTKLCIYIVVIFLGMKTDFGFLFPILLLINFMNKELRQELEYGI